MNISYKLLLTAILLTASANVIFSVNPKKAKAPAKQGPVNADQAEQDQADEDQADEDQAKQVPVNDKDTTSRFSTLRSKLPSVSLNGAREAVVRAGATVGHTVANVAGNRKVQVGAGVVAVAAVATAAYVYYSKDTVESLEAKIEKLKTEINAAIEASDLAKSDSLVKEHKALKVKLAELKTKQEATDAIDSLTLE